MRNRIPVIRRLMQIGETGSLACQYGRSIQRNILGAASNRCISSKCCQSPEQRKENYLFLSPFPFLFD
uniref:Uncharacterized protein n=1 Tax=Rhizophora mucronata TaxID=61149 RepID=A0A2P2IP74_RHIMU